MTRRRKSKIGLPKKVYQTQADQRRSLLHARAHSGRLNCERFGFSSAKLGKLDCCVFKALFAAKIYLDAMIGDDEIEWLSDEELETSSEIRIRGMGLRRIYNYTPKPSHLKYFELSEEEKQRVACIRSNVAAKPMIEGESYTTRRRRSRKGMITMKELAAELDMSPRTARSILRSIHYQKPERGWAWQTREEADKVKEILKSSS